MKELIKNAMTILGEKGTVWINALPTVIKVLSDRWELKAIIPVENMSYNYVAKAMRNDQPVVLKIGFDQKSISDERQALSYFNGNAAIGLLDYDEKYNALLLEQAVPGTTLKSYYPAQDEFVIDCYVKIVNWLIAKSNNNSSHQFPHIKDWLKSIDNVQSNVISNGLLQRAIDLKNSLLSTMTKEIVLHGDLHHDNILQNNDTWIMIDPKGIIGELEFEIAAFDFISAEEIKRDQEVRKLFDRRLNWIAEKTNLSAERIRSWVFIRLILSAVWHIEDGGDPSRCILLAEKLA